MKKKEFIEALRGVEVRNGHEFAGHGKVYIVRHAAESGRGGGGARIRVYRPGYMTDPNGAWYDYKNKTFIYSGNAEFKEKLQEAMEWCRIRYGITDWAKTPFGDWMDAAFVEARIKELLTKIKEKV